MASVFDNLVLPAASQLLGWTLRSFDVAAGTIEVGFTIDGRFTNTLGFVQGGFVAGMLDDTMGPAVLVRSDGRLLVPTITLTVGYLAPARPGNFVANGRVVSMGKTIAHLDGELFDANGTLVARATAVGRLLEMNKSGL